MKKFIAWCFSLFKKWRARKFLDRQLTAIKNAAPAEEPPTVWLERYKVGDPTILVSTSDLQNSKGFGIRRTWRTQEELDAYLAGMNDHSLLRGLPQPAKRQRLTKTKGE